jgi:hypothetical protein
MTVRAERFKFDAFGLAVPYRVTVSKLAAVPLTSVTFRTTALALCGSRSISITSQASREVLRRGRRVVILMPVVFVVAAPRFSQAL